VDVPERAHPRYAHEATVTFFIGAEQQTGRTKNLSRGGLCADLPEPIAAGTDVDVAVALVFADEAQSEALRLPARVAWCTPLDEGHQVGIAFRPLDAELAQYLGVFLRYLDDRKPEKSPRAANVDDRFR
jgi:PilZ domain